MHGSKPITFLALGFFLAAWIVGALFPWDVLAVSVIGFDQLYSILAAADRSANANRIMLVGSSPVHLGLSAQRIEKETGIPTFNLGTDGAGTYFSDYLGHVIPHVRNGDIVVVSNPSWLFPSGSHLDPGCTSTLTLRCASFRPRLFPHLLDVLMVSFNWTAPSFKSEAGRDHWGDAADVSLDAHAAIPNRLKPSDPIVAVDLSDMANIIHELHRKEACALLSIGPVLVDEEDLATWNRELSSLQSAAAKRGLDRAILNDQVLSTNRTDFLDTFEHPSARLGAVWTQHIADRLIGRSNAPCSPVVTENHR